jgi:hypothetical protein
MKLNNTFEITDTTQSTSKDTGCLVLEGGLGVERNLNVGGDLGVSGNFSIDGTTQSTSTTTGALTVDGGVGIVKNLNVGGDFDVDGSATIGDNSSDAHTFTGSVTFNDLVNLNGGIDVDNIDIGGTGTENTITTDSGDLVLDAASGQSVQINKTLSVSGNISGNRLDIDNVRIDGNSISCVESNGNLNLSANGTGIVDIQDTLEVSAFKINNDTNVYTGIDVDLSSVSSNDDTLASAKAIKGYVDTEIGAIDTKITISDGTTTDQVTIGTDTLTFAAQSNEITTTVSNNQVLIGLPDDVTIGSDLTVTDNLSVSGNTTLGNANTDTITANAKFASSLIPSGATRDLGNSSDEWRNLFITGTANIDSLVADTADINGGTIDATLIGQTTPSSGIFNLITVDNTNFNNNSIVTHSGTNASITINPDGTGQTIIQSNLDVNGDLDVSGTILTSGTNDAEGINMSGMRINNCSRLEVDNLFLDGDSLNSSATNGSITILPNGNGDVIIGDGTDNDLHCKGDVVAFHTSDITLKENITRIPDALDKVSSLSGNTFTWIKGHKYEGQDDTGVIAQEVEALGLPGLTTTRDDGTKAVRYERLIPVLIEAIKELKAEIDILKK